MDPKLWWLVSLIGGGLLIWAGTTLSGVDVLIHEQSDQAEKIEQLEEEDKELWDAIRGVLNQMIEDRKNG